MDHRRLRVAVIGGGFAGIAAAVALARRGVEVALLEARPRLGGRAYSRRDARTGDEFDNGQHIFTGACTAIVELCRMLGTDHRLRSQADLRIDFADAAGRRSALACPRLPAPWHLVAALLGLGGVRWRERLDGLRMAAALRGASGAGAASLDALTCEEWFERSRQPEALRRDLWRPLAAAIVNEPAHRGSALPLARVLAESFLGGRASSRLIFPAAGLSRLYEPAAGRLLEAHGGQVRTSAAVTGLRVDAGRQGDRVRAVEIAGAELLEVDAVVSAVPHRELPPLLPARWRARQPFRGLADLGSAPIVSVHLWLDRAVMDRPFLGLRGTEAPWVFDRRVIAEDVRGHALSIIHPAAHAQVARDRTTLVEGALSDLGRVLPRARGARCLAARVVKDRHATFSARPGTDALRPGPATPLPGLYLAGDWTGTGLPATIEGAVRSGFRAAAALLGPARSDVGEPATEGPRPDAPRTWQQGGRPPTPGEGPGNPGGRTTEGT